MDLRRRRGGRRLRERHLRRGLALLWRRLPLFCLELLRALEGLFARRRRVLHRGGGALRGGDLQQEEEEVEPVYALAEEHQEPMDAARVAAELGLNADQLETLIYYDENLGIYLSPLLYGNTVTRASFDTVMSLVICTTAVGGCEDENRGQKK